MMMMKYLYLALLCIGLSNKLSAQAYTLWTIGNPADTITQPTQGILLMGGATEDDQAMKRFLQYANHGDVVVIRTSGADGYNNYLYSQLGVQVNSVQTLLLNGTAAANDSFVVQTVRNAEALWIAGGDQWTYVSNWKNSPLNNAIHHLVNVKKAPIGGTSAGMAILGEYYNSAQGGSAVSSVVLNNPYDPTVTLGHSDFIDLSLMKKIITDTHFDNPDRRGRLMTFLARAWKDDNQKINAIACDEYTAVFIDSNAKATVYGGGASFDDNAYFVRIDCSGNNSIENCSAGSTLNWQQDSTVVKVYKIQSDSSGTQFFDLRNFGSSINFPNQGGVWQDWWVSNGSFLSKASGTPVCTPSFVSYQGSNNFAIELFPNPIGSFIHLKIHLSQPEYLSFSLHNFLGQELGQPIASKEHAIGTYFETAPWPVDLKPGIYFLKVYSSNGLVAVLKCHKY